MGMVRACFQLICRTVKVCDCRGEKKTRNMEKIYDVTASYEVIFVCYRVLKVCRICQCSEIILTHFQYKSNEISFQDLDLRQSKATGQQSRKIHTF